MAFEGYASLVLLIEHIIILWLKWILNFLFLDLVISGVLSFDDSCRLVLVLKEVVFDHIVSFTLSTGVLEESLIIVLLRSLVFAKDLITLLLFNGHEIFDLIFHIVFFLLFFDLVLLLWLEDVLDQLCLSFWEH